jgi:hypothetical protein
MIRQVITTFWLPPPRNLRSCFSPDLVWWSLPVRVGASSRNNFPLDYP